MKRTKPLIDGWMSFSQSRWWQLVWRVSVAEKHVLLICLAPLNLSLIMIEQSLSDCSRGIWKSLFWRLNVELMGLKIIFVRLRHTDFIDLECCDWIAWFWWINFDQLPPLQSLVALIDASIITCQRFIDILKTVGVFRIYLCWFILDGCESCWSNLQRPLVASS